VGTTVRRRAHFFLASIILSSIVSYRPDNRRAGHIATMEISPSTTDSLSGTVLAGRYELLEQIGSGGMSVVWKARNVQMDNIVCVKLLREQLFNETGLKRLLSEARTLATLDHPNILRVIGLHQDGTRCLLVTEFIAGKSLDQLLKEGTPPEGRIKRLFQQIAAALQYAHERGFVHRDIKPSNLFITCVDGVETAKILDFGIAKSMESTTFQKLTQSGMLVGTPTYMAPEQCSSSGVDARSDIYSLGCVLYQCLSGKLPFEAESAAEVMLKHLDDTRPQANGPLGLVAWKAMQKAPEDRFQTAAEFAQALESDIIAPPVAIPRHKHRTNTKVIVTMASVAAFACCAMLFVLNFRPDLGRTNKYKLPPFDRNARVGHSLQQISEMLRGPGEVYRHPKEIEAYLAMAEAMDPTYLPAACTAKGFAEATRNPDVAAQWFSKALELDHARKRANGEAARALSNLYMDKGNYEEAGRILATELDLARQFGADPLLKRTLREGQALGYEHQSRWDDAENSWIDARALARVGTFDHAMYTRCLVQVLMRRQDWKRAHDVLRRWRQEFDEGSDDVARREITFAETELSVVEGKRNSEALHALIQETAEQLQRMVNGYPMNATAHQIRRMQLSFATALLIEGKLERAKAEFREVLKHSSMQSRPAEYLAATNALREIARLESANKAKEAAAHH
jgi:serine/threonine protein kinase